MKVIIFLFLLASSLLAQFPQMPRIPQIPGRGSIPGVKNIPGVGKPILSHTCPPIAEWQQNFAKQYPNVNFNQMEMGKLAHMLIPMFADDLFQPVFGKPYTSLSKDERTKILQQKLHPCEQNPQYKQEMPFATSVDYAFNPFGGTGPLAPDKLTASLQALAGAKSSMATAMQEMANLQPSAASYDRLRAIAREQGGQLTMLMPSDREAFNKTLGDALVKSAQPALEANMQPLFAKATNYDGLRALKQAPTTALSS